MDFGLRVAEVDELISDPGIDVILNLTTPDAHFDVSKRALAAGKHVYSEKPVATTVAEARELIAEADRRGLLLGYAPDIFLGRPYQRARALIDGGAIGEPLSLTAVLLTGGHTTWHPNPAFLYQDGGGPLLDMGPYYLSVMIALLGPVRRVAGFASIRTAVRTIELGPTDRRALCCHYANTYGCCDGAGQWRNSDVHRHLRGHRSASCRAGNPGDGGRYCPTKPEQLRWSAAHDAWRAREGRRGLA